MPASDPLREDPVVHRFKNHFAVILGFCDLLLEDLPDGDSHRGDVEEIRKAARQALADLADLAKRPT